LPRLRGMCQGLRLRDLRRVEYAPGRLTATIMTSLRYRKVRKISETSGIGPASQSRVRTTHNDLRQSLPSESSILEPTPDCHEYRAAKRISLAAPAPRLQPGVDHTAPGPGRSLRCIWLAVRIVNRLERWPMRLATAVFVSGLYAESFGPARCLANRHHSASRPHATAGRIAGWP
jgi:hypothetical protein